MPATTGIVNGTNLRFYLNLGSGLTAVAYATSCSLDMSRDLRESVTKDSTGGGQTGWRTIRPGQKSGTLSGEGLVAFDADTNTNVKSMTDLFTAYSAGTLVTWRFTTDNAGDDFLSGSCYITGLSLNAGAEEDSTYSFNAEVDGTIYAGTES
jgi:hypothetical protein